jgi:hypothetical protein
VWDESQEYF